MNIEITKRHDAAFRIGLVLDGRMQKFTLAAAKQLRRELDEAIEWGTNMDDLQRESRRIANAERQGRSEATYPERSCSPIDGGSAC
jgi:hypothetical protein